MFHTALDILQRSIHLAVSENGQTVLGARSV